MEEITANGDLKEIVAQNDFVIVDCWAEWCQPCKMMTPIVQELETDFPQIKFVSVSVDNSPEVAAELSLRTIPVFLFYKNGAEVKRIVGKQLKKDFKTAIKEYFNIE